MLKDRIIIGVYDKKLQLKLLDGKNEPLAKVIEVYKTYEAATENKVMLNTEPCVNRAVEQQQPMETVHVVTRRACYNCGNDFKANHMETCKAKNISCRSCGRMGHFQRFCKSKGKQTDNNGIKSDGNSGNRGPGNNNNNNGKQQHSLDWGNSGNFVQIIDGCANRVIKVDRIYRINSNNAGNHTKRWYKEYQVGNQTVRFKLDTGSDVDCIPDKIVRNWKTNMKDIQYMIIMATK